MALAADEVVVDSGEPEIPIGIDGETVMMLTPVRCVIRPRALRVRGATGPPRGPAAQAPDRLGGVAGTGLAPLRAQRRRTQGNARLTCR
jgi:hypothetical protein